MTPFRPNRLSTAIINAAGSTDLASIMPHGSGCQLRVRNAGAVDVYVEFGSAGVTAAAPSVGVPGSMGIAAGAVEVFTLQQTERWIAVAVASGSPLVEVTVGVGE
jgi:hypothetical protein